jgi:protein-disulfide isomerase
MIPTQVNHISVIGALAISLACAPAGNTTHGAESTAVARSETVSAEARRAPPDSNITQADLARIQGSATAPVWVIEVSDFQCPFCKQWHDQTYTALRDQYVKTGKVRLAYVNYPLGSHVHAWLAAESAMCAGGQGKFWPMHDGLFATQNSWEALASPTAVFDSLANAYGLDVKRWRDCVKSGIMRPLIQADHDRAAKAGANATPSFMIGDRILTGAQSIAALAQVIDSALVKSKTKSKTTTR